MSFVAAVGGGMLGGGDWLAGWITVTGTVMCAGTLSTANTLILGLVGLLARQAFVASGMVTCKNIWLGANLALPER